MSSSTAADWQGRILLEVGAALEPVDLLTPSITSLWEAWAAKALAGPYLQYLYTKRQCLQILVGQHRNDRNASLGPLNSRRGERVGNLFKMIADVDSDIKRFEAQASAARPGAALALTQTAPVYPARPPVPPPVWVPTVPQPQYYGPSPNDPAYAGSPLEETEPA